MKTMSYGEYGGALRFEDAKPPSAMPGEVLVKVAATSFSPVDVRIHNGLLDELFHVGFPHVPGVDVAGTVAEIGEGVDGFSVGDAVVAFLPMNGQGASAEFALAPADLVTAAPTSVPLVEAAALPLAGLTAWQALFEHAELEPGQRVLINGAGGGVGSFAVQLGKGGGAHVIATASARSAEAVWAGGADEVVDYTRRPVAEAVSEPVDVVLNLVSASEEEMAALTGVVRPGGIVVSTDSPAHEDAVRGVRANDMFVRSDAGQLAELVRRVDAGTLHLDVTETYPLERLPEVHEQGADGAFHGKVVVTTGPEQIER